MVYDFVVNEFNILERRIAILGRTKTLGAQDKNLHWRKILILLTVVRNALYKLQWYWSRDIEVKEEVREKDDSKVSKHLCRRKGSILSKEEESVELEVVLDTD